MFDFRQLCYFVAVAEQLSFTRAALRLHLSQPPLPQQIRSLEQDFGVRLLNRSKRQIKLTEPGRIFLDQARQILLKADEARSQVATAAAGYSGHLRLAYTVSVSFHRALPRTLLRYRQIAPNVALNLVEMYTESQFAALLSEEIDAGFVRSEPVHTQDIRRLRLSVVDREPLLLAIPAGHPLAARSSFSLAEVAGDAFVSQPRALAAALHDCLAAMPASNHPSCSRRSRSTVCSRWSPQAWVWRWWLPACASCASLASAMCRWKTQMPFAAGRCQPRRRPVPRPAAIPGHRDGNIAGIGLVTSRRNHYTCELEFFILVSGAGREGA